MINLPAGLTNGKKIRINHMGHASDVYGSRAGDLLLEIKVKDHEEFKLDDLNVYSDQPITLTQAILGHKVTLNTVDGPRNIEI